MAWRSSGTTNDELVDNLMRFGVISSPAVERGFRLVDREHFVPQNRTDMAHSDQPLKEGNIHISAPHIYGSVLEALELHPNSSLSFLNVGSGTGYVSCIVATILGPRSNHFAIEIHQDAVQHAIDSTQRWKDYHTSKMNTNTGNTNSASASSTTEENFVSRIPYIEWIHGNALNIDPSQGESIVGFDRIYVGASIEKRNLSKLTSLLRPGGVLVGPVDDELVKVVRIGARRKGDVASSAYSAQQQKRDSSCDMDTEEGETATTITASSTSSSSLTSSSTTTTRDNSSPPAINAEEFTQQALSGVRFAPLLQHPEIRTMIPSRVWNPSIHQYYPDSFRSSCRELLLCSNASQYQAPPIIPQPSHGFVNFAGMLPRVLWMEILSYTHRDWFEPPESETEFLRRRLLEEQANAQRAHQARLDAEARCHIAEQERDVYRVLARRCQLRLENLLNQRAGAVTGAAAAAAGVEDEESSVAAESIEDGTGGPAAAVLLSGREQAVIFGLGAMLRSIQYGEDEDDHDEHHRNNNIDMEEDEALADEDEEEEEEAAMVLAEDSMVHQESSRLLVAVGGPSDSGGREFGEPDTSMSIVRQARTVSITGDDLSRAA